MMNIIRNDRTSFGDVIKSIEFDSNFIAPAKAKEKITIDEPTLSKALNISNDSFHFA